MLVKLKEKTDKVETKEIGFAAKVNTDKGPKINILFKRENRIDDVRMILNESDVNIIDDSDKGLDEIYKTPY